MYCVTIAVTVIKQRGSEKLEGMKPLSPLHTTPHHTLDDMNYRQTFLFSILLLVPLAHGYPPIPRNSPQCSAKKPCRWGLECRQPDLEQPARCYLVFKRGQWNCGNNPPWVSICEPGLYCGYKSFWDEFLQIPECLPNDFIGSGGKRRDFDMDQEAEPLV